VDCDQPRARVFISCGQASGEERQIADAVRDRLRDAGYEPYVAVREQSLLGLQENLFARLRDSEYFVFIDFRRERLSVDGGEETYRGSLFANQELAIASYLRIQPVVLQEQGVAPLDGMLGAMQANASQFAPASRGEVPDLVVRQVEAAKWSPKWRRELRLLVPAEAHQDANYKAAQPMRYFHVEVRNLHCSQPAVNCLAYVERVHLRHSGPSFESEPVPAKWAGSIVPVACIPPGRACKLDAFQVFHDSPRQPHFINPHTDAHFRPDPARADDYRLTFSVVSANLAVASASFDVHVGNGLNDARLEPV